MHTPVSVPDILDNLETAFNPSQADNLNACFQFIIDDDDNFYFTIDQQTITSATGLHEDPDITLKLNLTTFSDIIYGKLGGTKAFMTGRLKAEGNIILAKRLSKLFS